MATKRELEFVLKSIADGRGLTQINEDLQKTIFNARKLSEAQYNVVVKMVEEGKNLNQISAELRRLQTEERELARTAREAEQAHNNLQGRLAAFKGAFTNMPTT